MFCHSRGLSLTPRRLMNFVPHRNWVGLLLSTRALSGVFFSGSRATTIVLRVLFGCFQTLIDSLARKGALRSTASSFATQDIFSGCPCSRGTQ